VPLCEPPHNPGLARALAAALAHCLFPSGRVALDVIRHINRAARLLTATRWFRWIASSDGTKAEPSDGPAYRLAPGLSAYGASWAYGRAPSRILVTILYPGWREPQ
jgi:hypothetical protein